MLNARSDASLGGAPIMRTPVGSFGKPPLQADFIRDNVLTPDVTQRARA